VAATPDREADAKQFLEQKVRGKQVILKYDQTKYDDSNNLLAYVYLKNKTFINAHLIKHGLAEVDTSFGLSNGTLRKLGEVQHG
jgi:site-specific DNA-methyltransferase (adenine-specific)